MYGRIPQGMMRVGVLMVDHKHAHSPRGGGLSVEAWLTAIAMVMVLATMYTPLAIYR